MVHWWWDDHCDSPSLSSLKGSQVKWMWRESPGTFLSFFISLSFCIVTAQVYSGYLSFPNLDKSSHRPKFFPRVLIQHFSLIFQWSIAYPISPCESPNTFRMDKRPTSPVVSTWAGTNCTRSNGTKAGTNSIGTCRARSLSSKPFRSKAWKST